MRLKSHFLDEPLEDVVILASDIFKTVEDQQTIDQFFLYKSYIFNAKFDKLNAQVLLENLRKYKTRKNGERRDIIDGLKGAIDFLYADEKIKPEKLEEYTAGLVGVLQKTSEI